MDERLKKVKSRMERLCVRRECCSTDIFKKITAALGEDAREDDAREILRSLIEEKFIDDSRFCAAYAREKSSIAGWGAVKIRYALRAKRIAPEAIEAGLREIDAPSSESRLRKLLESKWKTLKDDPQGKLKLIRFALSRGYEYEEINDIVRNVCEASD